MNEIMEVVESGTVEILKIAIIVGIGYGVTLLKDWKKALIEAKGPEQYNANRQFAIDLVAAIEKRFNVGELVGTKAEEFEKLILEKIPGLDKATIDQLRDMAVIELDKQLKKEDIFGEAKKKLN